MNHHISFYHVLKYYTLICISTGLNMHLYAFDLPSTYAANHVQEAPHHDLRDWSSCFQLSYYQGSTHKAWDAKGKSTPLFTDTETFNLGALGFNLEGLTQAQKPLTWQYLRDLTFNQAGALVDGGDFSILAHNTNSGLFSADGHFSLQQCDLVLRQNIFSGFYLFTFIPIKKMKLNDISLTPLGDKLVAPSDQKTFDHFLAQFDAILQENNLLPYATPFEKTDAGDCVLGAGWQGYDATSFDIIDSLQGCMHLALTMPVAPSVKNDRVFSLPLGYQGHWGINARCSAQVTVFTWFAIGLQAGTTIFFKEKKNVRLPTSPEQNGWIMLEQAHVSRDLGTMWDIGGFFKADHVYKGFSALIGYTFTKQDKTTYAVHDDSYLKTLRAKSLSQQNPIVISQNQFAHFGNRLSSWSRHDLHFMANYDFGVHTNGLFIPQLSLAYHVPVAGKRSWQTEEYGGTLSLNVSVLA